jgi:rfaE bifunctional protein nucleotidyltransferase chain/domain/rfaE bifunctional protein kinase chain/domain
MSVEVTVVGEALLDVDVDGTASRLAPDAPVPVVDLTSRRVRPGGAALAATLLARDGNRVTLVTPLADDDTAAELRAHLPGNVRLVCLPADGGTPVKQRILASGQCLVRLDSGGTSAAYTDRDIAPVRSALRCDIVLVSDYGRRLTADPALRTALREAARSVPMVWDPHPRGAAPVPGTALVTPNEAESAYWHERLGGADPGGVPLHRVAARADALVLGWRTRAVVVTLGSRGAVLSLGDGTPRAYPAPQVPVADACGAGDAFAAAVVTALAGGAMTSEAVQAAVRHAALFVARGGAGAVTADPTEPASVELRTTVDEVRTPAAAGGESAGVAARPAVDRDGSLARQVRSNGGTVVATGGCFDLLHAGHVDNLNAARALGDCLVVCLNSDASVRRLKGPGRPLVPLEDRVQVLRSLSCVDEVVVFDEATPVNALRSIRPHIWVKGGDYAGGVLPEAAVLEEWGGQILVLPYVAGRSTSHLVRQAARSVGSRADGRPTSEEGL